MKKLITTLALWIPLAWATACGPPDQDPPQPTEPMVPEATATSGSEQETR